MEAFIFRLKPAITALLLLLMLTTFTVSAQEAADENARITWPPPVYLLSGEVELRGTANVPNMTSYYIGFQPLDENLEPVSENFAPATLPQSSAVVDGIISTWDTTAVEDGVYGLRLFISVRGGTTVTHDVAPIRVENTPPPFITPTAAAAQPTLQPAATTAPTTAAGGVTATISVASANVREGDGTIYPVVTPLFRGDTVPVLGVSSSGSGWFQVRLEDGSIGWIAPSVVTISGQVNSLQRVNPPPPPIIPTFAPTLTPVPQTTANLVAGIVVLEPATPTCAQTFNVGFDVANLGTQQSLSSGTVSLTDVRAADGTIQGSTIGGYPALAPGQTFRVVMPLTISTWYNEVHRITLTIDPSNSIPEANESDNVRVIEYVLQKGACP